MMRSACSANSSANFLHPAGTAPRGTSFSLLVRDGHLRISCHVSQVSVTSACYTARFVRLTESVAALTQEFV
jgi:hypothetical protein